MSNAGSLTEEIKDYIRDLKMSVKGYPLWKEYIDDIIQARQQLENLSAYVADEYLFTQFKNKFAFALRALMGDRLNTDNFYQQLFTSQQITNWTQLLMAMSQSRMEEHAMKRQAMLHQELHLRAVQREQALTTNVKISTIDNYPPINALVDDNKWNEDRPCAIHTNIHTNGDCKVQAPVRARETSTSNKIRSYRPSNAVHLAINVTLPKITFPVCVLYV
jgi:hypothetical protein